MLVAMTGQQEILTKLKNHHHFASQIEKKLIPYLTGPEWAYYNHSSLFSPDFFYAPGYQGKWWECIPMNLFQLSVKAFIGNAFGCGIHDTNTGNWAFHAAAKRYIFVFHISEISRNIALLSLQSLLSIVDLDSLSAT